MVLSFGNKNMFLICCESLMILLLSDPEGSGNEFLVQEKGRAPLGERGLLQAEQGFGQSNGVSPRGAGAALIWGPRAQH